MHAHRFYRLHRPLFFHLLISVIYSARDINPGKSVLRGTLVFFSSFFPPVIPLLVSRFLKGPTIQSASTPTLFPWSPSRRIVSRASCEEKRPTSRNVTSDIRETKCTIRRRERDRATTEYWGRIVNWLSMRLHSWYCTIARIREKFTRAREREATIGRAFRCTSKIIFENHFRKRRFHAAAWVRAQAFVTTVRNEQY